MALAIGRPQIPQIIAHYTPRPLARLGPQDERKRLTDNVAGKKFVVPDILSLMPDWPSNVQPDVDEINKEIDAWLPR